MAAHAKENDPTKIPFVSLDQKLYVSNPPGLVHDVDGVGGGGEFVGVTLGVGFTIIFTGTPGADLAQISSDFILLNLMIPSFLFV